MLRRFAGVAVAFGFLLTLYVVPLRADERAFDPYADIESLQRSMSTGALTAREIALLYLERIERFDRHGPTLRSVVEVNPDVLEIAAQLDRERAAGQVRGPLHGIPVLLKDNIDTADGMLTTAGSLALVDSRPSADAALVQRLRAAGAVILGKTNLSEWANFRSTRSSSGWSGRGGQTRNPYSPERNPCGSSSGSGVAVAAGLSAVAVGTETDGSIVCPSALNGIVGVKPTVGRVSRAGIIPISISQDTAGPMTRTVKDAALLLSVLAGPDPADAATVSAPAWSGDVTSSLDDDALRGARIGIVRDLTGFHPAVDEVFEKSVAALRRAGADVIDPVKLDLPDAVGDAEWQILLYEFKDGVNRYLSQRVGAPASLAELIEFNRREGARELQWFGQEIFLLAESKGPLTDRKYRQARATAHAARRRIDALLAEHDLDALFAPTDVPAWTTDLVNGDHYGNAGTSTPPAVAGYPHITVPAGFVHDLPVGVSFMGGAWAEPGLLRLAYAFEQATRARRPPPIGN